LHYFRHAIASFAAQHFLDKFVMKVG